MNEPATTKLEEMLGKYSLIKYSVFSHCICQHATKQESILWPQIPYQNEQQWGFTVNRTIVSSRIFLRK